MDKEEIRSGLLRGRRLVQEEWSTGSEIAAVDELVAEGVAVATPWSYRDGFQCEVRHVSAAPAPISNVNDTNEASVDE